MSIGQFLLLLVSGVLAGSFSNMLIYRLPRGQNWVTGRSKCPHCRQVLAVRDLIPIVSYVASGGRCRYCHVPIKKRYLWVEVLAPVVVVLAFIQAPGWGWLFWKLAIFYMVSLTIFFTDLETSIIPDELSLGLVALGLGSRLIVGDVWDGVYGVAIGFGVYFAIGYLTKLIYKKDTMGGGDIKLGAGIGAMWGSMITLYAMYFSFIIGAVIGIVLIVSKKKTRQDYIPFGPMIVMASIAMVISSVGFP